jgi:hypothetical protein
MSGLLEEYRCLRSRWQSWWWRRRASTQELHERRARLIRAFALHETGPARMGIAPSLRAIERELSRRGIATDENDWMQHLKGERHERQGQE